MVTVSIENTGSIDGAEVVQLYVSDDEYKDVSRPLQELKGFEKVYLPQGEKTKVKFVLDSSAFSYYNETDKKWIMKPGNYTIMVGSSSRDIRQQYKVIIE